MIDIINVEQTFGDRRILKNVNLQINKGETMVILGPPAQENLRSLR